VAKTRGEIEALLEKHGATKFASMYDDRNAMIGFAMRGRLVKFMLMLPDRMDPEFIKDPRATWRTLPVEQQRKKYDQELRRIWRSLLLVIKAKLESVESEIMTFEQEFMPFIVLANGRTLGETILPQLDSVSDGTDVRRLIGAPQDDLGGGR
jgi:hypothetical protein